LPNWCYNKTIVEGPKDEIESLINDQFDFNKIYPIPESEKENWYNWSLENWGVKWNRDSVEIKNFNSKEENIYTVTFQYNTAWGPALKILDHLQNQHNIKIKSYYCEEGPSFVGLWENGQNYHYELAGFEENKTFFEKDSVGIELEREFNILEKEYEEQESEELSFKNATVAEKDNKERVINLLVGGYESEHDIFYASDRLKKDKDLIQIAVFKNFYTFKYADPIVQQDENLLGYVIDRTGSYLQYAPEKLKNDYDFVLRALQQKFRRNRPDHDTFKYASDELKKNKNLVLKAIKYSKGFAVEYISENLKNDPDIALQAANSKYGFSYLPDEIKKDRSLFLIAAKNSDRIDLIEDFKNDKEIILQNPILALQASDKIKSDKNFLLQLIEIQKETKLFRGYIGLLGVFSENLRNDKEIAKIAIESALPDAFDDISDKLKNDYDILKLALSKGIGIDFFSQSSHKDDVDLGILAIKNSIYQNYELFSDSLRGNKEIALLAVETKANNIMFLPLNLRNDPDIFIKSLKTLSEYDVDKVGQFIGEQLRENKEFFINMISAQSNFYKYISENLKKDKELALLYIHKTGDFNSLHGDLKKDPDIALTAIKSSKAVEGSYNSISLQDLFESFPPEIQKNSNILEFFHKCRKEEKQDKEINKDENNFSETEIAQIKDEQSAIDYIKKKPSIFLELHPHLQNNVNIIIAAINGESRLYHFVNPQLKKNKDVAIAAVKAGLFKYIELELRDDPEIVDLAIKEQPSNIQYAPEKFANSKEYILKTKSTQGWGRPEYEEFLNKEYFNDIEVIKCINSYNLDTKINYNNFTLDEQKEIYLNAASYGNLFDFNKIEKEFLSDKTFLKNLTNQFIDNYNIERSSSLDNDNIFALMNINADDEKVLMKLLNLIKEDHWEINPRNIYTELPSNCSNNKNIVKLLCKKRQSAFIFLPEKFKNDREIISIALRLNGNSLEFANDDFKKDVEIVKIAMKQNKESYIHADVLLRNNPDIVLLLK